MSLKKGKTMLHMKRDDAALTAVYDANTREEKRCGVNQENRRQD